MPHIFLSYSRKDGAAVSRIYYALRGKGYAVWQDLHSIDPGDTWEEEIENGLKDAPVVIVLWSVNASQSEWVGREIDKAKNLKRRIIPILFDDTELRKPLSAANALRFDDPDLLPKLITGLAKNAPETQRKHIDFKFDKPLDAQPFMAPTPIKHSALVRVPLLLSSYASAYIVGLPKVIFGHPKTVIIGMQFSRAVDELMVGDVYAYAEAAGAADAFQMILITGPVNLVENKYDLDVNNPAQWEDSTDTVYRAISLLGTPRPRLQIFGQVPSALSFAVGMRLAKFWPVELFQFQSGKYKAVLSMPAEGG